MPKEQATTILAEVELIRDWLDGVGILEEIEPNLNRIQESAIIIMKEGN